MMTRRSQQVVDAELLVLRRTILLTPTSVRLFAYSVAASLTPALTDPLARSREKSEDAGPLPEASSGALAVAVGHDIGALVSHDARATVVVLWLVKSALV
ncbi:hypothetical protein [Kineococcus rubinsiae]|uniref:hypothetical protein n=1 Tax=Kineococcus rubinsiae TaxID=2609562 RepID=UPI00143057FD|nr:hypothetical protein [Kineococcus rubinsiae]NIZ90355.1 hypothetical protein [Kineococcus rubinsiae]